MLGLPSCSPSAVKPVGGWGGRAVRIRKSESWPAVVQVGAGGVRPTRRRAAFSGRVASDARGPRPGVSSRCRARGYVDAQRLVNLVVGRSRDLVTGWCWGGGWLAAVGKWAVGRWGGVDVGWTWGAADAGGSRVRRTRVGAAAAAGVGFGGGGGMLGMFWVCCSPQGLRRWTEPPSFPAGVGGGVGQVRRVYRAVVTGAG